MEPAKAVKEYKEELSAAQEQNVAFKLSTVNRSFSTHFNTPIFL
jgi:hypothetical protein